jgi:cell division protease FtsH
MGPMVYGQKEELVFLGREISEQRDYSEAVAEKIDAEVSRIVKECYQHAKDILTEHKGKLIEVAEKLLDQETISKEEFEEIFPSPTKKTYGVPLIITD